MKKFSEKILVFLLILTMAISGITPRVLPTLHVAKASSEEEVPTVTPEPTNTPMPTVTVMPTSIPENTPTPTPVEPTPSVVAPEPILSVIPKPSATPEITPSVTPTVTPTVTPLVTPTPELSFGLFSVDDVIDLYTIKYSIDVSLGEIVTITPNTIQYSSGGPILPYVIGDPVEITGTGAGIVRVTGTGAVPHLLILNNVNVSTATGTGGNVSGNTLVSSPIQIGNSDTESSSSGSDAIIHLASGTSNSLICNGSSGSSGFLQAGIAVVRNSNLTITGTGELTARGGHFAAGIGGSANRGCGNITIKSGTVTASSFGPTTTTTGAGAGIGGGGSNTVNNTGTIGTITIEGDANVTATSNHNGAGIGSGGTGSAASIISGETVIIKDTAIVNATSTRNGAGIGGGGSENTTGTAAGQTPGHGGSVTISGSAQVTATSGRNGAGIGGGGTNATSGTPGDGGSVNISGNPIVAATGKKDIGAGASDGIAEGNAGTIIITGGNVKADPTKSDTATNDTALGDDTLGCVSVELTSSENHNYPAISSTGPYSYEATANEAGEVYLWLPLGNQLVVDRELYTLDSMGIRIFDLVTEGTPFTVVANTALPTGYQLKRPTSEEVINSWIPTQSLEVINYYYEKDPLTIHALEEGSPWVWNEYTVGDDLKGGPGLSVAEAIISKKGSVTTITKGGVYVVNGTLDNGSDRISVNTTEKVVIVLYNANWTNRLVNGQDGALVLETRSNVLLVVMDGTNNSFVTTGRADATAGSSATKLAGITVRSGQHEGGVADAKLVITAGQKDEDFDTTDGFNSFANSGTLFAKSEKFAAGIGGGCNQHTGAITILASNVRAEASRTVVAAPNGAGGNGAGIGGGGGNTAGGGTSSGIRILGWAKVNALARGIGAGIGGGGGGYEPAASGMNPGPGDGGDITIDGSEVEVTAKSMMDGAGIGGGGRSAHNAVLGNGGEGGTIIINDAKVKAESVGFGAGIGGGGAAAASAGAGGTINITGTANIIAQSGVLGTVNSGQGAGIGGGGANVGNGGASGDITIEKASVTAISVQNGAGIGGGGGEKAAGDGENITITKSAVVEAKSGIDDDERNGQGAGIGGGGSKSVVGGNSGTITIDDKTHILAAISTQNGAGIGGGGGRIGGGNADLITIDDATVYAKSGDDVAALSHISGQGAGIGGGGSENGYGGDGGVIEITSGDITASSTYNGAGIGGGGGPTAGGIGGIINISNGQVKATSGDHGIGAAIGGGGAMDGDAGAGGIINLYQNANVTATSTYGGAGIGGGGSKTGNGGNGGIITIKDFAIIRVSTGVEGAGIGGGGTEGGSAGSGGEIKISGQTDVRVKSQIGAAIGGGSSDDSGNPGNGGEITIFSENPDTTANRSPIVVAESIGLMDIGPGTLKSKLGYAVEGDVVIKSGNVRADPTKVFKPTNGRAKDNDDNTDPVGRISPEDTETAGETVIYETMGSEVNYNYLATSEDIGDEFDKKTYIWIPYVTLTVAKKVRGPFANTTAPFDFELVLKDVNGDALLANERVIVFDYLGLDGMAIETHESGQELEMQADMDGKLQFQLEHNEAIRFRVPIAREEVLLGETTEGEVTYVVEELNPGTKYTTTTSSNREEEKPGLIVESTVGGAILGEPGRRQIRARVDYFNERDDIVASAVNVMSSNFFGPMVAFLELIILAALLMKYDRIKRERVAGKHFSNLKRK